MLEKSRRAAECATHGGAAQFGRHVPRRRRIRRDYGFHPGADKLLRLIMHTNPLTAERERMILDPTIINLNTGSFGPLPKPVFERVTELRRWLAAEPTH